MARYEAGDHHQAARLFRELLAVNPDHANALQFLGFHASQSQKLAEASGFYRRAAEVLPDDPAAQFNLALALMAEGELDGAIEGLDRALAINPDLIEAMLYRGSVYEQMQRPVDAARAYLRAARFAEDRLDPRVIPTDMKRFLNHALQMVRRQLDAELERQLAPLAEKYGELAIARLRKAGEMFSGKIPAEFAHPKWRPGLFYVPDLPPRPFFEREEFPWTERVEEATAIVREELLGVMTDNQGFAPYVNHPDGSRGAEVFKGINRSRDWSAFHFFRHGERIEENCARCPRTAALLDSIDLNRVPGYGPEAMFSVLRKRSKIPAHYGTVTGRLVVHLPLIVPANCGALRVHEETRGWTEGKLMMFDDTFEHEAWNDSDETRVVLIFDTWNPYLTPAEREAFCAVLAGAQRFEQEALA